VFVGKANGALCRPGRSHKDIDGRFLNSLVVYHPKVLSGSSAIQYVTSNPVFLNRERSLEEITTS
jgi:hypothetical protein